MWTVDRLKLTLPAGFEHRASRIARLLAEELAGIPAPHDLRLASLTVPPLEVGPATGDREIAGRIARSIASGLPSTSSGVEKS